MSTGAVMVGAAHEALYMSCDVVMFSLTLYSAEMGGRMS